MKMITPRFSSSSVLRISSLSLHSKKLPSLSSSSQRNASAWTMAVERGENVVLNSTSKTRIDIKRQPIIDPLALVGRELSELMGNIRSLLGSREGVLDQVAKYYFQSKGKQFRPLIVLLMSQATSVAPKTKRKNENENENDIENHKVISKLIDSPLSPATVLNDYNPDIAENIKNGYENRYTTKGILPTQRRLAEITEMIHTASLLHDDVIDNSDARRGQPSGNAKFGNKMAILAGDFLLGRASVALARLRDAEVIELLATVIANLVEGEFMQLKNLTSSSSLSFSSSSSSTSSTSSTSSCSFDTLSHPDTFEYYMQKTYLKTASLISKSCRAAALLGGSTNEVADIAYTYGRNLGLAFQLVDDMLDYSQSAVALGKPSGADLKLGLATAPVLYAWEEYPELGPLIERKFEHENDVIIARDLVSKSRGLERTRDLAILHCQKAIEAIETLPLTEARSALVDLTRQVINREK